MNINCNLLINKSNNEIEQIILNYKDPSVILHLCTINQYFISACIDPNGFIWNKLLEMYYSNFLEMKHGSISLKDFYVLLYFTEKMNLMQLPFIIYRSQKLLNMLPKLYHNDHIIILNSLCTSSILSNKAKIAMFRTNDSSKLNIRYVNIQDDCFLENSNDADIIPKAINVNFINGSYLPIY